MKFPKVDLTGIPVARQALTAAREQIESRKERYICYGIDSAGISNEESAQICNRILAGLEGCLFLEGWLAKERAKEFVIVPGQRTPRLPPTPAVQAMREFRLAWIDHMLKELQDEVPES